jgi:hypothetical protein
MYYDGFRPVDVTSRQEAPFFLLEVATYLHPDTLLKKETLSSVQPDEANYMRHQYMSARSVAKNEPDGSALRSHDTETWNFGSKLLADSSTLETSHQGAHAYHTILSGPAQVKS